MIMEKCADLVPEYFRFVRGVVDSPDLSLNISRELLQHDRQLKVIGGNLEKKVKSDLLKLREEDREKYETFWKQFGRQVKYGVVADYGAHKDVLKDLLLFWSELLLLSLLSLLSSKDVGGNTCNTVVFSLLRCLLANRIREEILHQ